VITTLLSLRNEVLAVPEENPRTLDTKCLTDKFDGSGLVDKREFDIANLHTQDTSIGAPNRDINLVQTSLFAAQRILPITAEKLIVKTNKSISRSTALQIEGELVVGRQRTSTYGLPSRDGFPNLWRKFFNLARRCGIRPRNAAAGRDIMRNSDKAKQHYRGQRSASQEVLQHHGFLPWLPKRGDGLCVVNCD